MHCGGVVGVSVHVRDARDKHIGVWLQAARAEEVLARERGDTCVCRSSVRDVQPACLPPEWPYLPR